MNPLALATLIVAVVSLTGVITAMVLNARKIKGYQEFAAEAKAIKKKLNGQLFRDGDDLVVSGNYQQLPTIVRLSQAENTPGLSMEVKVPSAFTFSLTPRQAPAVLKGTVFNVPNLSTNFVGRTDSVLEANQLIDSPSVRKALSAICISQKTFLNLMPGRLLIEDLLIPSDVFERVMVRLQALSTINAQLEKFPGADKRKPKLVRHDRTSWAFRAALAAGIIVTIAVLAQNAVTASSKPTPRPAKEVASSIAKNDAILIPKIQDWRPVEDSNFDPDFTSWMQSSGAKPSSELMFSADSSRLRDDKVYFLTNAKGQKRVVAIVDHRVALDGVYEHVAGVAIVPMDVVSKVEWPMSRTPFKEIPGDGLLIVRDFNAKDGATLLFFGDNGHVSGMPENYQQLDIRQ
jgi:hypothetical protein